MFRLALTLGVLVVLLATVEVGAETLVVPNSLTSAEGNQVNAYPFFKIAGVGGSSHRYQQVFESSQFVSWGGPQYVTGVAFRAGSGVGFAEHAIPHVQVSLSTTTATPDSLSYLFSENVGNDETVAFDGEVMLSSGASGLPGAPREFGTIINLQRPFRYDPGAGNLLLEVKNYSLSTWSGFFDAHKVEGDSISRLYIADVDLDLGARDTLGLVVRFTSSTVPEPSTLGLLTMGAVGLLAYAWRPRRKVA